MSRTSVIDGAVVVGAGPAGVRCATMLARAGHPVTLIGEEPGAPYDRVALSRYLAHEIPAAELMTALPSGITHHAGITATTIDRNHRQIRLSDGAILSYHTLVLATGSAPMRLPQPGATLPGVLAYRTLADVEAMIGAAAPGIPAVIIGGGLLGLEAAAGLAARGMAVTVLHAVDRLMERQLDHTAAARLAAHLAAKGISLVTEARCIALEGDDHVQAVRLADGQLIPARIVVMAIGIRPRTDLARAAGLEVGRGITVDAAMRTSDPAILAIGECAEHAGQCIGLVAPAMLQADIAAQTVLGHPARYQPCADSAALKVAGAPVWSAGEVEQADTQPVVLDDPTGPYRRLLLRDDRLVGALLYGDVADAAWYMRLIRDAAPLGSLRASLPFGPAYAPRLMPPGAIAEAAQ